jgi:hypothetical protein
MVEQGIGYINDSPRLFGVFCFCLAMTAIPFFALGYVCSRFSGK